MVRQTPATAVMERIYCDGCNVEMKWGGEVLPTNPEQYKHVCNSCGCAVYVSGFAYPRVQFVEVPQN